MTPPDDACSHEGGRLGAGRRSPRVASYARLMEPVGPRSARPGAQLPTNTVHRITCMQQRTAARGEPSIPASTTNQRDKFDSRWATRACETHG